MANVQFAFMWHGLIWVVPSWRHIKPLFTSQVDVRDAGVGRAWNSRTAEQPMSSSSRPRTRWRMIRHATLKKASTSRLLDLPGKKKIFQPCLLWFARQKGIPCEPIRPQLMGSQWTEVQISSDQASSMAQGKASSGTVDGQNPVHHG